MSRYSPFTIPAADAGELVNRQQEDNRQCFLIQLLLKPVYGDTPLPQSTYKKLPRLINGIPLGAGRLSQGQTQSIQWRYVEGCGQMQTFVSVPITRDEAEKTRQALRDRLIRTSKAVFGDITVKSTVILSEAIDFESDVIINDIADTLQEGLLFHD